MNKRERELEQAWAGAIFTNSYHTINCNQRGRSPVIAVNLPNLSADVALRFGSAVGVDVTPEDDDYDAWEDDGLLSEVEDRELAVPGGRGDNRARCIKTLRADDQNSPFTTTAIGGWRTSGVRNVMTVYRRLEPWIDDEARSDFDEAFATIRAWGKLVDQLRAIEE